MSRSRVLCTCDECLTAENPKGSWIPQRWKQRHDVLQFARFTDRQSGTGTRSRGLGLGLGRGRGRGVSELGRGLPIRGRGPNIPRARGRTIGMTSVRAQSQPSVSFEPSTHSAGGGFEDIDYSDIPMDIDSNTQADASLTEPSGPEGNTTTPHICTPQAEVLNVPVPAQPASAVEEQPLRRSTRKRTVRVRSEVMSIKEKRALEARALQAEEERSSITTPIQVDSGSLDNEETENTMPATNDTEVQDLSRPSALPTAKPRRGLREIYTSSHDVWFVRIAMTLVAFVYIQFNVPFRACNLILYVLNALFLTLRVLPIETSMPTTLQTVMSRLELEDRFLVFPVCSKCHRFFNCTIPADSTCPDCDTPLFRPTDDFLFSRIPGRKAPPPLPELCAPLQNLSSLLAEFLSRPGMEEVVGSYWKKRPRKAGFRCDIMDGDPWQTLKGPNGKLFFDPNDQTEELRIGVNLGIDW